MSRGVNILNFKLIQSDQKMEFRTVLPQFFSSKEEKKKKNLKKNTEQNCSFWDEKLPNAHAT